MFNPANDDIRDFVKATRTAEGETTISVDTDGPPDGLGGGLDPFADVAKLEAFGVGFGIAIHLNLPDDEQITITSEF